jgi:hypothetical protein
MKKIILILVAFCAMISQTTAQWAVYNEPNYSVNPGVSLTNSNGATIQVGVATYQGSYCYQAKPNDVVIRTQGGGNTILSIPTWSGNDARKIVFSREDATLMEVMANGQVKIGSVPVPSGSPYKLFVGGGILTEQLKVALATTSDWADYVFDKHYKLPSLSYVEKFVNSNHHLPNIPSAQQLTKEGVDVVQMQSKMLEKIEELTLYVIQLNKKNQALESEVKKIKAQNRL